MALRRWHFSNGILNPASMKQALVEGAEAIPGISMYEQGQGKLDLVKSQVSVAQCPQQYSHEDSSQRVKGYQVAVVHNHTFVRLRVLHGGLPSV